MLNPIERDLDTNLVGLMFNSLIDRKPVQRPENRTDVVVPPGFSQTPSSSIPSDL